MFQIEPVLWLQSFDSAFVSWFFQTVTNLGYTWVYIILIMFLAFAVRMRPALVILVCVLLTGIMTDALKTGLGMPRPVRHYEHAAMSGEEGPETRFEGVGATGFWSWPSDEAIEAYRTVSEDSFGMPSGHVGAAAAFFLALALAFRSRGVWIFASIWIPLMALSRMYLGRHFLADVLFGVAVGAFGVAVGWRIMRAFRDTERTDLSQRAVRPLAVVSLSLLILTPFTHLLDAETVGRLLGLLVACAFMIHRGFPSDSGGFRRRAARFLLAGVCYVAASRLLHVAMERTGWEDARLGEMAVAFVLMALILLPVELGRRLGLFRKT